MDALELLPPGAVQLAGWVGRRVAVNAAARLALVDEAALLAGFRQRPGSHPWIGEHVGKWLHAAALTCVQTGDAALRAKVERVAAGLIATQEPDGYLGTYLPGQRFGLFPGADWDVWVHKYCLIGLLACWEHTDNAAALAAYRRMADLLLAVFGPGGRSLLTAGTHVGMAATSVLEPLVLLHRHTGDARYLEFAEHVVRAWDEPGGPRILSTLLTEGRVDRTANGKAYEMLSNLVGLCELYRTTGTAEYLQAPLAAWADVVRNHLYLTGSASSRELFGVPHRLPNEPEANVGETCVTVTWMQLNLQLLRLTGEARFAHEFERSLYNHLTAAQHPEGALWCYYTPLEGTKPYGPGLNCCVSSGPRGLALAPQAACLRLPGGAGLALALLEPLTLSTALDGQPVNLEVATAPRGGGGQITVRCAGSATFRLRVRRPAWADGFRPTGPGDAPWAEIGDGWWEAPARIWRGQEEVRLEFTPRAERVAGRHGNAGRAALRWGPFVLAYDDAANPDLPAGARPALPPEARPAPAGEAFVAQSRLGGRERAARFLPFAEAGAGCGGYRIWLPEREEGAPPG